MSGGETMVWKFNEGVRDPSYSKYVPSPALAERLTIGGGRADIDQLHKKSTRGLQSM
jgi:hypothetical protein